MQLAADGLIFFFDPTLFLKRHFPCLDGRLFATRGGFDFRTLDDLGRLLVGVPFAQIVQQLDDSEAQQGRRHSQGGDPALFDVTQDEPWRSFGHGES